MSRWIPATAVSVALLASHAAGADRRTIGKIDKRDPRLDQLVAADAAIEVLADGFKWSEGPIWDRAAKRLLFSDVPNNTVHAWSEAAGLSVFLKPSGYTGTEPYGGREPGSNGLTIDAKGRLVLCQHGDKRVARREGDAFVTLADKFEGKRFNSPNDLVYAKDGSLYFTDPPYGRPKTFDDPGRELTWQGVYRLSTDGKVSLLVKDLKAPNGIGLSPDGKTLYVAQSDGDKPYVMAYPVQADGSVGTGRIFFDATSLKKDGPGGPDGLKVDKNGNLFATGPGGVMVLTPKGEHLGTIHTGVPTANCAFGDDGSTLYLTANDMLCRVKTKTKGLGF
jgi:gluconolactonase